MNILCVYEIGIRGGITRTIKHYTKGKNLVIQIKRFGAYKDSQ